MPTAEKKKKATNALCAFTRLDPRCVHREDFLVAFLANIGFAKVAVASNPSDKPLLSI